MISFVIKHRHPKADCKKFLSKFLKSIVEACTIKLFATVIKTGMDKFQVKGRNPVQAFNSRSVCIYTMHFHLYEAKLSSL